MTSRDFGSRDNARLWIINNQLGRRNLPPVDKVRLLTAKEAVLSRQASARMKSGKADPTQNFGEGSDRHDRETSRRLAKEAEVSGPTYDALSTINESGSPELVRAVREKSIGASTAAIVATLPADQQAALVAQGPAAVREAARKAKAKPEPSRPVGPPRDGMRLARMAILDLEKIAPEDAELDQALALVATWLADHGAVR